MKICDNKKLLNKINDYDPDEYWCIKKQRLTKNCSRCRSYINLMDERKTKLTKIENYGND